MAVFTVSDLDALWNAEETLRPELCQIARAWGMSMESAVSLGEQFSGDIIQRCWMMIRKVDPSIPTMIGSMILAARFLAEATWIYADELSSWIRSQDLNTVIKVPERPEA
jgi:hypothetical protein